MKVYGKFTRMLSALLSMVLVFTMMPQALFAADDEKDSWAMESPTVIRTGEGDVELNDDWIAEYPYGAFAFGAYQSDVAEKGALTDDGEEIPSLIRIPVYRVGGTSGRVTAKITYMPSVTMHPDGDRYMYDYAASGKKDVVIRYENPKAIAQYQQIGMPDELRNMKSSDVAVVFEAPDDEVSPEDDVKLTLTEDIEAESFQWQIKNELGWVNVKEAEDCSFPTSWAEIWDFDADLPKSTDYRCIYVIDGVWYCTESLQGETYKEIPDVPKMPEDFSDDDDPTYSVLEFEDDYDVYEFDLTFADGETVKYIEIEAIDDDEPELPELGLFTIAACEGGDLTDLCNTHTLMVSDNEEPEKSEIAVEVTDLRVDRSINTFEVVIKRTGGKNYNLTVDYTTVDGTAKKGVDYAEASGTVALVGSIDEIRIPVQLIANGADEDRQFSFKISNIRGGGTDDLCVLGMDETVITIEGTEPEKSGDGSGLNLATVLAGADGEDLTANVKVGEDAMISDTTVAEWHFEGAEGGRDLVGTINTRPATRSHTASEGLTFTRPDDYADSGYWRDWEIASGSTRDVTPTGEGINALKYMTNIDFETDDALAGVYNITNQLGGMTTDKKWPNSLFFGYTEFSSNWAADGDLYIYNAGKLFSDFTFGFYLENNGTNSGGLYVRPSLTFTYLNEKGKVMTDSSGNAYKYSSDDVLTIAGKAEEKYVYSTNKKAAGMDVGIAQYYEDQPITLSGTGKSDPLAIPFEASEFHMSVDFNLMNQWGTSFSYSGTPTVMDDSTKLDLYRLTFKRRAFGADINIPVVIYTANDSDEIGTNGWAEIDNNSKLYTSLAPVISIAPGNGGVSSSGGLYVGSILKIDCSKGGSLGFSIRQTDGVYLTNAAGKTVAVGKATATENVWELTLLWDDMTEDDLSANYQINVAYDRSQPVKIDITPSVPRTAGGSDIDPTKIAGAWAALFNNGKTIKIGCASSATETTGTNAGDTNYSSAIVELKSGGFNGSNGVYTTKINQTNVQWINFGQEKDDVILFKGHAYKGNENIYLSVDDITSADLTFFFYDSEYLDSVSTMAAHIDHVDLYYDKNGNGKIDGTFSGGIFTLDVDKDGNTLDTYEGIFKGEHYEANFAPKADADGTVHQYFAKTVYTLRPRALKIPVGGNADDRAQVFPVLMTAITDAAEAEELTDEQKAYRYIKCNNADGHLMYGSDATALSYIDVPLGGDYSVVERFSVTTAIYDQNGKGEKIIDTVNETEYKWEPTYIGSLLVPFTAPQPVTNYENITGKPVDYAGETPARSSDGSLVFTSSGVDKLNAFLGALAGRSTFGVCVQEQKVEEYNTITSLKDIVPESIEKSGVSSLPNADNILNMGSADEPGDANGSTPPGTGFDEFGSDLGINLPSLEFGIGDYATIVMDGSTIGFSIGIPLAKVENTNYTADNETTMSDGSKTSMIKDDDGHTVVQTIKPDGTVRKVYTDSTEDTQNNRRTVTKTVTTTGPDGTTRTYHEVTELEMSSDPKKPDKVLKRTLNADMPKEKEKTNAFKEANGQMGTLKDFIGSIVNRAAGHKGSVKDFFSGCFEDDTLKNAKNGQSTCKKVSVSFMVQLAVTFEYNPVYNKHKFSSAGLSATLSFEFTLQHRLTPVPIVYVYVKTGISVEVAIGLAVDYKVNEDKDITSFEKGDLSSLKKRNGNMVFKLGKDYEGFHLSLDGKLYMEIYDHMPADGETPVTAGMISGNGIIKEVLLGQYDKDLYISLTAIGAKANASGLKPINVTNKVYFDGVNITPSLSVEAGVGLGIELLHFELFVKTNIAITITFGKYNLDTEKYDPVYMSSFEWALAVGFNVTILFINYSMDCIAFSVSGGQQETGGYFTWDISATAANGMKELWSKTTYTDAHGNPISDPTRNRSASGSDGMQAKVVSSEESLVRVSKPTDITGTQRVNAMKTTAEELERVMRGEAPATRAIQPTGTDAFQLSGYGTSGDARLLVEGLTTGYTYKLFKVGEDNYIIYPLMIENVPQLVLSKVMMVGDLTIGTGLQNPVNASAGDPYIKLDNDDLSDYDFSVAADGTTVTAVWTCDSIEDNVTYSSVKRASIDLSRDSAFSEPEELAASDELYRYLPEQAGNATVYAESLGSAKSKNEALKAYLIAKNQEPDHILTEEMLDSGNVDDAILASAVYTYVTLSALNDLQGGSTTLTADIAGTKKTASISGEVLENIESAVIGGKTYVAYTTSKTAYFDTTSESLTTIAADNINADTEYANVRSLYVRELTASGFGTAKLLQTVVDFEGCTADNIDSAKLKDGIYVGGSLSGNGEADPHYANLSFLTAKLEADKDAETFLLFEMGGNTYILRQADLEGLFSGSSEAATLTPIFEKTSGTDVTIGSDENNLAVVYTAAMPNTVNNAIWIAWWDVNAQTWGEPSILAMRHLQIYEDSIKYGMTPEDTELAYLGAKTPGENSGDMSRLTFSNLQISTRTVRVGDNKKQQLLVLTEGSMIELEDFKFENSKKEQVSTVIPKRITVDEQTGKSEEIPPNLGFYAIAFGEGEQALGEGTLELANYDFNLGDMLVGEVNFKNTGTTAIRASKDNPMTIILSVSKPGSGSQDLAKWLLNESIPSGGKARLTFSTDPLTEDLPTGSVFSISVSEDAEYFKENTFSASLGDLLTVDEKAELTFGSFDAEVRGIEGDKAVVYIETSVLNTGNKDADQVFIQFSYDTGNKDGFGNSYAPIDLTGHELTTGFPEIITRSVSASNANGVYKLADPEGGTKIAKGYMRKVSGTVNVPLEAFLNGEGLSGLHLKAEVYSSDDNPSEIITNGKTIIYSSDHEEYNQRNNAVTRTLKHVTFFSAPNRISTALGNTLRLPVPYDSTGGKPNIAVTEINNGTEDWEPLLGILYYDSSTGSIVAAANEKAREMIESDDVPAGIIQIKDISTNSIEAITYRITEMGDGINIFKDDLSFTFYNSDDSATVTDAALSDNQSWYFSENVPADVWKGGDSKNEAPMNYDLSFAREDGAYVTFITTADTITIYYKGDIQVSSDLEGFTAKTSTTMITAATDTAPAVYSDVPGVAVIEFNNKDGLTHTVTITALTKGTELDRYHAEYTDPVIPTDIESPQILWNRSFPQTASLLPGAEVPMRCYILDDSGISKVVFDGVELSETTQPALIKVDDGFWYFDYTFTENGNKTVTVYDTAGNSAASEVPVYWFNSVLTDGAISTAPGLSANDLSFTDAYGNVIGTDPVNTAPWLTSAYIPADNETSHAYMFAEGEFSDAGLAKENGAEKWKAIGNGYYMVRVDRDDETWARAVVKIDNLDLTDPQLSVSVEDGVISYTVSDDKEIVSVTINGALSEVNGNPCSGTYEPELGGSYTIRVTDDAGNVAEETVMVKATLVASEDAVETEIEYKDGKLQGSVTVDPEKISGGDYDEDASDSEKGDYRAVYSVAVVPKGTDPADLKDEDFVSLKDGAASVEGLEEGEYEIYVRDSAGNYVLDSDGAPKSIGTFTVAHPDDEWNEPEYTWSEDCKEVTASRQSKLYPEYIQSETVTTTSEQTKDPTCEEKGETTYTAVFENTAFETQAKTVDNIDALGHEWGEWTVTKEQTSTEAGEETHYCTRDKSHKETRSIPPLGEPAYTFTKGVSSKWTKGSGEDKVFVIERSRENEESLQHFTGVEVDGELIDPENFTAEEGLKITVLSEYLETLGLGSHTIRVVFDDGFIETGLAIAEAEKEPEPEYSFVKGSNVKWKEGDLEFIVRRSIDDEECFSHFTGIKVDGAAVDVLNYTAKQGSTVITVKEDYLKTLEAGTHEITAEFDDGNVTAAFTVEAEEPEPTPPTGDRANPLLWGGILVVCVLAAAALWITRRKKKDES